MLLIYIILQLIPFLHTAKWKGAHLLSINQTAKSKHFCFEHILTKLHYWQWFCLQIDTANAAFYVVWLSTLSRLLDGFTSDYFAINHNSSEIAIANPAISHHFAVNYHNYHFIFNCFIYQNNSNDTETLCWWGFFFENLNNQIWAGSRFTVPWTPFLQTTVTD